MLLKAHEITEEQKQEIREQHPNTELIQVYDDDLEYLVLVKKPTSGEYNRFKGLVAKGKEEKALDQLIKDCTVYPKGDDYLELMDILPGMTETIGNIVVGLAGVYQKAQGKKF